MKGYFNVRPKYTGSASSSTKLAHSFESAPSRKYVSHSKRVKYAILSDKPADSDVGQLVSPVYDDEDTIKSGRVNPLTDPCMSPLDRFEYMKDVLGLHAAEAQATLEEGKLVAKTDVSTTTTESTTE
ncbi:hypothetical protein [uncultured Alistipes sp.]|jgi:hypothetical protein|uniref:hypothetical protein n=1 Tax=uncultured Alistipes sp. TaxID=538949 RepID=UPI0025D378DD|nr:hypothetical protein [uncultured Alistipes sp.]